MKKSVMMIMLMCTLCMGSKAQEKEEGIAARPVRSLSAEFLGAHTVGGVNYDARLRGNAGLGYRIGLGYAGGGSNGSYFLGNGEQRIHGVEIPLEVNYLFGKKRSKLEVGLGSSLGYYRVKNEWTSAFPNAQGQYEEYRERDNRFGYLMFANVGYRLQPVKGFMFRVGLTPSWTFGGKNALSRGHLYPYLGFGYAF